MRKDFGTAPNACLGMITVTVGPNRGRKGWRTSESWHAIALESVQVREEGKTRQHRERRVTVKCKP